MKGKDMFYMIAAFALMLFVVGGIVALVIWATGSHSNVQAGSVTSGVPNAQQLIGGCELSTVQTAAIASYDYDKPGTAVSSPTTTVYLNAQTGELNAGGTNTTPGSTYTFLSQKSNFFADLKTDTTTCVASFPVSLKQKAVDTAVSMTVFDQDGVTLNSATNQSIGSGGSATIHVNMVQSANYKHLGGVDNRFVVYLNSTNVSDWNPTEMSVIFDGKACTPIGSVSDITKAQPSAITGQVLLTAVCDGDFLASDGSTHKLDVKLQANNGVNPMIQDLYVNFAGVDYYKNTISGAVEKGAVKDDGSAIQALQSAAVHVS